MLNWSFFRPWNLAVIAAVSIVAVLLLRRFSGRVTGPAQRKP